MIAELTPEAQRLLRQQLERGKYASEAEVLEEGLRALADRDEREQTIAAVRQGVADAEAGRVYTVEEAFDRLVARHPWLKST